MKFLYYAFLAIVFFSLSSMQAEEEKKEDKINSSTVSGLKFRLIGPGLTSGRIIDFAVEKDNPSTYYVAVACGGVWKTTNSGHTFEPIFDSQPVYSIGCITIDPNNPHVVWVGSGENNSQRSVAYGNGIYKSCDGGKSWKHMGLKESRHIGKIIVDPNNSDIIYVAAFGPLWAEGGERGLYKSTDGGKTWELSLEISEHTGVSDIVMDPRDSKVIYAASYQRRRHVWTLINGGPEAAIHKTVDGGKTWNKLTGGLPGGELGRIGLAISPVNPDYVYAQIEAYGDQGGFFRTTDRGASWKKMNPIKSVSAQYYQELFCDPKDVDKVYSIDTYTKYSEDGGKTWNNLGLKFRHVDDHALWIDPNNTDHLLIGGDGGVYETFDHGANWRHMSNLPVTQFYRVAADNDKPFYNVYGGTQDNNTWGAPSQTTNSGGILNEDWYQVVGGDGYEPLIDPENPNIVYGQWQYGNMVRYDRTTGEIMRIQPIAEKGEAQRWNWDTPALISPHDNKTLFMASNRVYKSTDRGMSWEAISPDLTRQIDRNQLEIMGKIWSPETVAKNASTSLYGNIVSLDESILKEGLIYAGTDDGLIQVTDDGGKTWTKIEKVGGLPEKIYVSDLFASRFDEGTVFATFNNHKSYDLKPYVFKSTDKGKTWTSISSNLPEDDQAWSIVQDHENKDLLFLGTEFAVFFTIDGGKNWVKMKSGLPAIAMRDLEIQRRENDLILGTFGRGIYILDDYTPLRTLSEELLEQDAHIFPIEDALMYNQDNSRRKNALGSTFYRADNPPYGATFTYYIKETPKSLKDIRKEAEKEAEKAKKPITYPTWDELREEDNEAKAFLQLVIKDASGNVVRTLKPPYKKGISRVNWSLTIPSRQPVSEKTNINKYDGYPVVPGTFTATLFESKDGISKQLAGPVEFNVTPLIRSELPAKNKKEREEFYAKLSKLQGAINAADKAIDEAKEKVNIYRKTALLARAENADVLMQLSDIERKLTQLSISLNGDPSISKRSGSQPPSISERLIYDVLYATAWTSSDITKSAQDSYSLIAEEFAPLLDHLKTLVEVELKAVEQELLKKDAPWLPGEVPDWKPE
jgi:photosystem II stability/assembly factor-like uncharacterized protein